MATSPLTARAEAAASVVATDTSLYHAVAKNASRYYLQPSTSTAAVGSFTPGSTISFVYCDAAGTWATTFQLVDGVTQRVYFPVGTVGLLDERTGANVLATVTKEGAQGFAAPDGDSEVLFTVPKGARLTAYVSTSGWYALRGDSVAADRIGADDTVYLRSSDVGVSIVGVRELVNTTRTAYQASDIDQMMGYEDYDTFGSYFNSTARKGTRYTYPECLKHNIVLDEDGLPMALYNGVPQYNIVTMAQCALTYYEKFIEEGEKPEDREHFLKVTDWLVEHQSDDGALRYEYAWWYYIIDEYLEPGWASSMVQGQSISAFARAYHLTGDEKYITAGDKALEFLVKPESEGGLRSTLGDVDPSLEDYIYFDMCPADPHGYTLNGYMYTLLGVYDWKTLKQVYGMDGGVASFYFSEGLESLEVALPYFDLGDWSVYDLGYLTYPGTTPNLNVHYTSQHNINPLHALYTVTGIETFNTYETRWRESLAISVPDAALGGDTRYQTACAIAEESYIDASPEGIIVVSGQDFPDAMTASALAGVLDYPILLTPRDTLHSAVSSYVNDNPSIEKAIIVGGDGAVSDAVKGGLENLGITTERLWGDDRYSTADAVRSYLTRSLESGQGDTASNTAIIANGYSYADALSISPYAAASGSPLFMTSREGELSVDDMQTITASFGEVIIVGGTGVVSPAVEQILSNALGSEAVIRLGGATRYDTSSKIAVFLTGNKGFSWSSVTFASGVDFPDALAGGPLCGSRGSVLLLANPNSLQEARCIETVYAYGTHVDRAYWLGGTAALPQDIRDRVLAAFY